jgi:hypothetical protein
MASILEEKGDITPDLGTPGTSSADLERTEIEVSRENTSEFKRPFSNWRWALVCSGLYLSALLYGQ